MTDSFYYYFLPKLYYMKKHPHVPLNVSLRVVLIRHGEKPSKGDNLCPKGLNRALELPAVLDKMIGVPDFTYVPRINTGDATSSVRMFQTITPFAVKHGLTINSSCKDAETGKVANRIKQHSGMVLAVWDHTNIPAIAAKLGVTGKLKWAKDDFDSIWIIDFLKGEPVPVLTIKQENLDPKGACK